MKKTASLLLALCLLLTWIPLAATAESKEGASSPILFRGIPWGTSYAEFSQTLELGVWSEPGSGGDSFAYRMYGGEELPFNAEVERFAYCHIDEVAGYPVEDTVVLFARVPGGDGLLTDKVEDSALFYARYRLRPADAAECEADLIAKLTRLYGEADTSHEGFILWHGAEGTAVSLVPGSPLIGIRYCFEGCDDLLQAAQDAIKYEHSLNVDGL